MPWWLVPVSVILILAWLAFGQYRAMERELALPIPLPAVPTLPPFPLLFDTQPLRVRTTVNWRKVDRLVPRYRLVSDPLLWNDMHFEDWDHLSPQDRHRGLDALVFRFGFLLPSRRAWNRMSASDWDNVPQPVRAMAFLVMIEDWTRFYDVGQPFDLTVAQVLPTIQALAMTESWFDHRATFVNADRSVDMGLGGSSAYARDVIRRWYKDGRCDFTLADADYYNPWHAARFLVFWFGVMLHEANGDVQLAIRGYNWGVPRARNGAGEDYLTTVQDRRSRYLDDHGRSPTWTWLMAQRRLLLRLASVGARQRARIVAEEARRQHDR